MPRRSPGPDLDTLVDNDPLAIEIATRNLIANGVGDAKAILSEGFRDLTETNFTRILCNPPYHTDFSVPKHFIEKGFNRLALGGQLWMVTKRDAWYRNKLRAIFGGVRVHVAGSYFVFEATKTSNTYASRARPCGPRTGGDEEHQRLFHRGGHHRVGGGQRSVLRKPPDCRLHSEA